MTQVMEVMQRIAGRPQIGHFAHGSEEHEAVEEGKDAAGWRVDGADDGAATFG